MQDLGACCVKNESKRVSSLTKSLPLP